MKSIEYFILEKLEDGYKFNLLNIWNKDTLPDIIENIKQSNISRTKNLIIDFENLKELQRIDIINLKKFLKKIKKKKITNYKIKIINVFLSKNINFILF